MSPQSLTLAELCREMLTSRYTALLELPNPHTCWLPDLFHTPPPSRSDDSSFLSPLPLNLRPTPFENNVDPSPLPRFNNRRRRCLGLMFFEESKWGLYPVLWQSIGMFTPDNPPLIMSAPFPELPGTHTTTNLLSLKQEMLKWTTSLSP